MKKETSLTEQRLMRHMASAIQDFNLIEDGDHLMVAISGGKDSYAMLHLLREMQKRSPAKFKITAVHLDQVQPGYDGEPLRLYLEKEGYDFHILRQDTYSVVKDKIPEGKTYCSLCSRLRRGVLYSHAIERGYTKIALGHHRNDLLETFMLNLLFAGQLKSMPPRLVSDDGRNVVIRPLAYCREEDLITFSQEKAFPILPCNLCGSQENLRRKVMKQMIADWEERWPGTRNIMMAALGNIRASHIPDPGLWQRLGLSAMYGAAVREGAEGEIPTLTDAVIADELGF